MNSSLADARTQPGELKTVADILAAAADLIEPEGRWVQGASCIGPNGDRFGWAVVPDFQCLCALGALAVAQDMEYTEDAAISPAGKELREAVQVRVDAWNDAPERTQAEVVAALRAAAEKARTANSVGTSAASEPQSPEPHTSGAAECTKENTKEMGHE